MERKTRATSITHKPEHDQKSTPPILQLLYNYYVKHSSISLFSLSPLSLRPIAAAFLTLRRPHTQSLCVPNTF